MTVPGGDFQWGRELSLSETKQKIVIENFVDGWNPGMVYYTHIGIFIV